MILKKKMIYAFREADVFIICIMENKKDTFIKIFLN